NRRRRSVQIERRTRFWISDRQKEQEEVRLRMRDVDSYAGTRLSGRGSRNDQTGEEKHERRREQAVTAKRMQPKGLDKQQPECDRKHREHRPGKEFPGAAVIESREGGKSEHGEIGERAQTGHGNAANLGVRTTEHFKTIGGIAADRGLSAQKNHGQISRFRQTDECNQSGNAVENDFPARTPSGRSCRLVFFHSQLFMMTVWRFSRLPRLRHQNFQASIVPPEPTGCSERLSGSFLR